MKFEVEERFILIEKALHARVNEHKTEKDFSSNLRTVDGKPQQKYSFSRIIVVQEGTWYPSVRTYGRYQPIPGGTYQDVQLFDENLP